MVGDRAGRPEGQWMKLMTQGARRRGTLTVATLALLGMMSGTSPSRATSASPPPSIGVMTPTGPLDLTRFKGKVIYLDFWASWCAPCKLEFPFMDKLAASYPPGKFMVIAVDVDHGREKGVAWLTKIASRLPIVYDSDGAIAKSYGVSEMPTTFLIGRDGRIRYIQKGFFPEQEAAYQAHVEALLNEK